MDTRLTVADCRTALYTEVDATDINSVLFLPALNEVVERYINSGKWKGATPRVTLPVDGRNYISLPYWYQSVLVMRYQKVPRPIFTQFYEFSESGPGEIPDADNWTGVMVDLGDGFPTQVDIVDAGPLRITITTASDAAKTIRLFGEDENGNDIYSSDGSLGINVTTANPTVTTSQTFSKVTGIQAASTIVAQWTLSVINDGTPVLLSTYWPGETRPHYRRYQTGVLNEAIQLICHRRFVPLRNETDWVIPGNQTALRYGLKALAYEKAGQIDMAQAAFTTGLNYLNQEAKAARGGARISLNIIPLGLMGDKGTYIGA
jgi:hypothetical protein